MSYDTRPNVNVIYQEGRPATTPMGCLELVVSVVVIVVLLLVFGVANL